MNNGLEENRRSWLELQAWRLWSKLLMVLNSPISYSSFGNRRAEHRAAELVTTFPSLLCNWVVM